MFGFVVTVTVLTLWLTLAASSASQDCVDMVVSGNNSVEVQTFTSKKEELLFFPDQNFEGITIKLAAAGRKSTKRVTREDLCAMDSSHWNSLEVMVHSNFISYHQCTFRANNCSGKCGWIQDYTYDDFESFTVEAHGASYWSLYNITHKTRCTTPIVAHTTPAVWLTGVGCGAVVLLAVITVACIARRRLQSLRLRERQQEQLRKSMPIIRPQPIEYSSKGTVLSLEDVHIRNSVPSHPAPPPPVDWDSTYDRDSLLYLTAI